MLVKNLSPFPYGTLVTSRRPPRPEMVVVVRGTFEMVHGGRATVFTGRPPGDPLAQGVLTGETYGGGDDVASLAVVEPSDLVPFKVNAEVLVVGSCHAPQGKPVTECPVEVRVGGWSKGVMAVGRRAFSDGGPGAIASRPLPFTSMPLGYDRSFGGPGYPLNPAGLGAASDEAPNVEHPGRPTTRRDQRPATPAGLGPLNVRWPQRASKVGTRYGADWKKTRAPWVSEDFDWSHHHAGPPDQQLPGYLRGDEKVTLTNLHREHPTLETQLPGLRVRAFAKDVKGALREVPMAIDTLVVRSDDETLTLTWRGLLEVTDDELEDVATLLVASEELSERPLPESHYAAAIAAFEADPLGAMAATPPELLRLRDEGIAQLAAIEAAEEAGRRGDLPPERAIADRIAAAIPPSDPRRSEVHAQTLAAVQAMLASGSPGGGARPGTPDARAELAKVAAPPKGKAPSPIPLRIPSPDRPVQLPPNRDLAAGIDQAIAEARKVEQELTRDPTCDAAKKGREAVSHLEALRRSPEMALVFKPRVEPGPGRDLSDQDLQDADLRGADLTGANLEGSILTRADLRGARLRGARLSHAVLFEALLEGADLAETTLILTQLGAAKAAGASFAGAAIDRTIFDGADLTGADLAGMTGAHGLFHGAILERASLDRVVLHQSIFDKARLDGATLRVAQLKSCLFLECSLAKAQLGRADLRGTSFLRSRAVGAAFTEARGEGVVFLEATVDDGDFERAVFPGGLFTKAHARNASFYGADLRGGRFRRAVLDGADLQRSNLKEADLRKTSLHRTSFRGASLFMASLLGSSGKDADFTNADLARCEIDVPR